MFRLYLIFSLFSYFLISDSLFSEEKLELPAVYLTWDQSPLETITVRWFSDQKDPRDKQILYRLKGTKKWEKLIASTTTFLRSDYFIHNATIHNLYPDTDYEFMVFNSSEIFWFRSLPKDPSKAIRFVVGGDVYRGGQAGPRNTDIELGRQDPMFVVFGGDLVYVKYKLLASKYKLYDLWVSWINSWKELLRTPNGRMFPILAAIGNHDVRGQFKRKPRSAHTFYELFPFPKEHLGYQVLDFGNRLSLFLLDTAHTNPISADQTNWLHKNLSERSEQRHKLAVYHVPAYPSHRSYKGDVSSLIRKSWVPLFDRFGLHTAFEHHDHTLKRTPRLRNNQPHPEGVLYLGDGAWSSGPREVKPAENVWFLEKTKSVRHFWLIELDENKRSFTAINGEGGIEDLVEQNLNH
ncbi:MAG: hypothetical protein CMO81_08780 [Waddliaceae bacterium]|nr:hypothetical protein [Waddliaceae bacterium]